MTEDQLEQEALGWLAEVGYSTLHGPDIACDGDAPERSDYRQVVLVERLRAAVERLNPAIPAAAREDAIQQVVDLGTPVLLSANKRFHQLLVAGVPVQYQKGNETRGDFVRLIDWNCPSPQPFPKGRGGDLNEWLAINQFSIKGPHYTRRPDVILFVNGLPLVLLELKNPADEAADIWKAYDQIQTYKEQIPDVFHYNEVLVISDGSEARLGSLSGDAERFMQWRTIDGMTLDPLGQFNELETLIRGVLAPAYLLDYLRYFVLFEDDGTLVKKVAGYHQFHAVRAAINHVVTASRPGGTHKGGVVWHTQGSGKSITMTCFAARVMQEVAMENPTIVVITDRNDLDGQLFGVFSLAQDLLREQPVQADTRQDLRAKLANRPSGGIVFATIQKFMLGEDEDTLGLSPAAPVDAGGGAAVLPLLNNSNVPLFKNFAETWFAEKEVEWRRSHRVCIRLDIDKHLIPYFGEKSVNQIKKSDSHSPNWKETIRARLSPSLLAASSISCACRWS